MRQKYCECGRRIVIKLYYGGRVLFPRDNDHLLCQQCYRSERDREHARTKGEYHDGWMEMEEGRVV